MILLARVIPTSALDSPAILVSSGFSFLKKFLWCLGLMQWLNISSLVPQALLHPSRLQVYMGWSDTFLGLVYSVMYSSPMGTKILNICIRAWWFWRTESSLSSWNFPINCWRNLPRTSRLLFSHRTPPPCPGHNIINNLPISQSTIQGKKTSIPSCKLLVFMPSSLRLSTG